VFDDLPLLFFHPCRPLIKTRVTMKRREFGNDNNGNMIDKEPGESTYDLKTFTKQGG